MADPSRPTPPLNGPRRLGPAQMAFVRCWAEGLDLVGAWTRYLYVDGAGDARRARGELTRLLDQLRSLARAHGRPDIAALLLRDPEAIVDAGGRAIPTLEEFAAAQPDDYYSEAELVELYQSEYGHVDSRSAARRRQRLRERLVLAIQWFVAVGVRAPAPDDAVTGWLDERVARRLAVVGIRTLGDLVFWIRTHGFHWHRAIPRLGPVGAARLVRWIREHESTLGALPSPVLLPHSRIDTAAFTPPPRIGIVPLERFVPPSDRDGSRGSNRAPAERSQVKAANDREAVQAWLQLRAAGSHTWRAYRKEAERFLLWAVLERRRALSSLDGDDCRAYRDFLAAPGPAWTGPRHAQRWTEAWRPFEGPLSARSQAVAVTIVRGLCGWLVRRRYLASNPWDEVPAAQPDAPSMAPLRALSPEQWARVLQWLADELARTPSPALHRLKFILEFASLTGLRLAELAAARLGWLRHEPLDDGQWVWSIRVPGRRSPWRDVPLPEPAVEALRASLLGRHLDPDPRANDPEAPLISKLNQEAPLSAARIYDILVAGFERCAAQVWSHDRRAAERIREASTHWLRHTYGSLAAARGVPQEVLQANLGHASLATTSIYVRADVSRRQRTVQQAFAPESTRV